MTRATAGERAPMCASARLLATVLAVITLAPAARAQSSFVEFESGQVRPLALSSASSSTLERFVAPTPLNTSAGRSIRRLTRSTPLRGPDLRAAQPGDSWNVCRHLNIEIGESAPVPPAHGQQVRSYLQDAVGHREREAISTRAHFVHLKAARNVVAVDKDAHIVVDRYIHDHVASPLRKFKFLSYQDIRPRRPRRLDITRVVECATPLRGSKSSSAPQGCQKQHRPARKPNRRSPAVQNRDRHQQAQLDICSRWLRRE